MLGPTFSLGPCKSSRWKQTKGSIVAWESNKLTVIRIKVLGPQLREAQTLQS